MSQATDILNHIKTHGAINPLMALERYGCMRLAARISELRQLGHEIESRIKTVNTKAYAEYYMKANSSNQEGIRL